MRQVTIRPVDRSNWETAIKLDIQPHQRDFTPPVAVSLAKCYIRPDGETVEPWAVYAGPAIIGFFTFTYDPASEDIYWLNGFLIDRRYQGQGYGRAALAALLDLARRIFPRMRSLSLTVHPANQVARHLYLEAGFKDTGRLYHDELVFTLRTY